jgi:phosphoribosylaminoimidazolecarboxamide formyltransferase/IMP cyclohydrolase
MPRALLSVTDKLGIVEFAKGLVDLGFEIVSTGGTARALREAGIAVTDVSEVTGVPEILGGRVKTLHPKVHGGILADLADPRHVADLQEAGIEPFDVVCVNLYAFQSTIAKPHELSEAVESIDIGGPAMIRAAAKNSSNVLVVVDPNDYKEALCALADAGEDSVRLRFAAKAFRHTAAYDASISRYLTRAAGEPELAENLVIGLNRSEQPLRYGENPHQAAARYLDPMSLDEALAPLGDAGKEISYDNWLDADAAWGLAIELPPGSCVIVKHGNPCGAALGNDLGESYKLAKATDPVSSFGGVVAFHGPLSEAAVRAMTEPGNFLEVVIGADGPSEGFLEQFRQGAAWTANTRFLKGCTNPSSSMSYRSIRGGMLVQEADRTPKGETWRSVTNREPTEAELEALRWQWTVVRHVKSNAIAVGVENRLMGVGAGQMNRVQSVRLALEQAGEGALGSALASDAFFPFPDSVEAAANAGITAIVQPGGSKKDPEVIAAANDRGLSMVFTGTRHFRH